MNEALRRLAEEMGGKVIVELPGRVGFTLDGEAYTLRLSGHRVILSGLDKGKPASVEVASALDLERLAGT